MYIYIAISTSIKKHYHLLFNLICNIIFNIINKSVTVNLESNSADTEV